MARSHKNSHVVTTIDHRNESSLKMPDLGHLFSFIVTTLFPHCSPGFFHKRNEKLILQDMKEGGNSFESILKCERSLKYAHPNIDSPPFPVPEGSPV